MAATAIGTTVAGSPRWRADSTGSTCATRTGAPSPRLLPSSAIHVMTGSPLTKTPSMSIHDDRSKTQVTASTGSHVVGSSGRTSQMRRACGAGMHRAAAAAGRPSIVRCDPSTTTDSTGASRLTAGRSRASTSTTLRSPRGAA